VVGQRNGTNDYCPYGLDVVFPKDSHHGLGRIGAKSALAAARSAG